MRALLSFLFLFASAQTVEAEPFIYDLDKRASKVEFRYLLDGNEVVGSFPDFSTRLILDFDTLQNSRVDVALAAATTKAGLVFASPVLRGPKILNAAQYPVIRLSSTKIMPLEKKVSILADVTIKDVTRPITLVAQLARPAGTSKQDLDSLALRITGRMKRSEFGIVDYKKLVGDIIRIDVTARIVKRP